MLSFVGLNMKVGFLSRWNATCGVSLHAEMIGRELVKLGHKIIVYAPTVKSASKWWHHRIISSDEEYVYRCYEESSPDGRYRGSLDKDLILSMDLDALIIESYTSIPYRYVEELVIEIKKRRGYPVILVVHEGSREDIKYSRLDIFDSIVVFDERYIYEVLGGYGRDVYIIPYPCNPPVEKSYKKLGDVIKFFTYGRQPINEYNPYLNALDRLYRSGRFRFRYIVYRSDGLLPYSYEWMEQYSHRLSIEELSNIIREMDVILLPKSNVNKVVVSSTFYQIVGFLTPIIAPNTRHFEAIPKVYGVKPIVLFDSEGDLINKIVKLIEDEDYRISVIEAMRKYALIYNVRNITMSFLNLIVRMRELVESIRIENRH